MRPDWEIIRMESDFNLLPFDCGDSDLNDFYNNDAKIYHQGLMAVTYILHNTFKTIAFWSYLNDKISIKDLDGSEGPWVKRFGETFTHCNLKSFPAVKMGRLAVDLEFQNQGIGKQIIDFTKSHFLDKNKTGCRFITVDAYSKSLRFYEQNGFKYLSSKDKKSDTRLMYYDLSKLGDQEQIEC